MDVTVMQYSTPTLLIIYFFSFTQGKCHWLKAPKVTCDTFSITGLVIEDVKIAGYKHVLILYHIISSHPFSVTLVIRVVNELAIPRGVHP